MWWSLLNASTASWICARMTRSYCWKLVRAQIGFIFISLFLNLWKAQQRRRNNPDKEIPASRFNAPGVFSWRSLSSQFVCPQHLLVFSARLSGGRLSTNVPSVWLAEQHCLLRWEVCRSWSLQSFRWAEFIFYWGVIGFLSSIKPLHKLQL